MLAMVTEAAELVGCVDIRKVVGQSAFRCVEGTLAGDELWSAFASTYGLAAKHRTEWFLESPIIEGHSTWVLRANVWGKKTDLTIAALTELTAGEVTATLDWP